MNQRSQDLFKGLRTAYNTLIQFLASNGSVAIALCGSPAYYMITFAMYQSINYASNPATYAFSSSSYTLFGILFLFWILAMISVWKLLPNLLTVSIFVFTCIGHWCLVSGAIMVFYGWSQLPYIYTSYLLSGLLPSILLLLISGDILRGVRKRFYGLLERPLATTTTGSVDTGTIGAPKVEV